jgi:hypothetical protein
LGAESQRREQHIGGAHDQTSEAGRC